VNFRVFASEQEAATACAAQLAAEVRARPELVLGLPTGRSPINVYRELAALHGRGELDLSRTTTFNLDEFLGLPPDDPTSFRAYMERHLFQHVNLAPERIHFFDGSAPDAEGAGAAGGGRSLARADGGADAGDGAAAPGEAGARDRVRRQQGGGGDGDGAWPHYFTVPGVLPPTPQEREPVAGQGRRPRPPAPLKQCQ
jgi:hypothetical protein